MESLIFLVKRSIAAWLALLFLSGCSILPSNKLSPTETVMWSTYPLFSEKVIGTCFLVAVKDRHRPGQYRPIVVTSSHMLKAVGADPLYLPLRMIGGDGSVSFLPVMIGGTKGTKPFYVRHPERDVAAFPLPDHEEGGGQVALRFLEEKNIRPDNVRPGENVSFLGFPEGLAGTWDLFAVLREGRIASYDPLSSARGYFLINGDVYPGDSGSPVFRVSAKGDARLAGMIIQRVEMSKNERSPIALAVDVDAIRETLALLARRDGY